MLFAFIAFIGVLFLVVISFTVSNNAVTCLESSWLHVCMQFKAQILSIDRYDDDNTAVECSKQDNVEPSDNEQTPAKASVSTIVTLDATDLVCLS